MARTLRAGDENNRPLGTFRRQRLLQLEPVETRHGDIEYSATGNRGVVALREFPWRRIRADVVSLHAHQPRQRLDHAGVVIDDEDRERFVCHWAAIAIL
jgi:hypothetical protein